MKKILLSCIALLGIFLITGCDNIFETVKGEYKEGTYMGSVEYVSHEVKYVTTDETSRSAVPDLREIRPEHLVACFHPGSGG
jgi:uncharacterized protein YxeA